MLPVVRELETEYTERMTFEYLDFNQPDVQAVKEKFAVRGYPTFIATSAAGTPTELLAGRQTREALVALIEKALA